MKKIPFDFKKLKVGMEVELGDSERGTVEEITPTGFYLKKISYGKFPWDTKGRWSQAKSSAINAVNFILVPEEEKNEKDPV